MCKRKVSEKSNKKMLIMTRTLFSKKNNDQNTAKEHTSKKLLSGLDHHLRTPIKRNIQLLKTIISYNYLTRTALNYKWCLEKYMSNTSQNIRIPSKPTCRRQFSLKKNQFPVSTHKNENGVQQATVAVEQQMSQSTWALIFRLQKYTSY